MKPDPILGRGVRFPFRPGADGGFAFVDGEDNVAQSLRMILSTAIGERQMRFRFGSELPRKIFEPIDAATLAGIETTARDAIVNHEHRVSLVSLSADPDPDVQSKVNLTVEYEIPRTSRRGNIVFPFYLDQV